jgi:membrane protease YdiL (CAAX protease family)
MAERATRRGDLWAQAEPEVPGYAHVSTTMPTVPPPAAGPSAPSPPAPSGAHPEDRGPPWPLWFAPGAIALGFGLGIIATVLVDVVSHPGSGSSLTVAEALVANLLFDLGFVAAAIYFAGLRGRPRPRDFGFRRVPARWAVLAVVLAGAAYYLTTLAYASLFSLHGTDKLSAPLGTTKSTVGLAGLAAFVCVFAPVVEEFFFRGFLFGVLRRMRVAIAGRDLGTWVAAIITGILFGLAHYDSARSEYLIPLGLLGFLLCLVRWKTGSLYPCIALHSVNNAVALGSSQFHWDAGEIVALTVGCLGLIGLLTLPLARVGDSAGGREAPA